MKPPRARSFDVTSLAGLGAGIGMVLVGQALEGGGVQSILQWTAAVIVFGGTFGATLLSFSLGDVRHALRALDRIFWEEPDASEATIAAIGRFAVKARKEGIMALEDDVERVANSFMKRGLGLAVDGTNPATLRSMLEAENDSLIERDEQPARVFEAAGGYAPTIGILGAVLGLIQVMQNLSDPSRLGEGIAVAFVATVYGVGSANLLFLPIAAKLRNRAASAARQREVALEGILAIQEGLNPRLIEHKLRGLVVQEPVRKSGTTRPGPTRRAA